MDASDAFLAALSATICEIFFGDSARCFCIGARRQRTSMSAYFTNSLTPPSGLGHWRRPAADFLRSGSAWLGRSQKDGLPSCRAGSYEAVQGHRLAHREGQPGRCLFLIGSGNGRQDARPCFICRPVALLRRLCLDCGSRCFRLGLFCARCSWNFRRSRGALALTFAKSPSTAIVLPRRALGDAAGATSERSGGEIAGGEGRRAGSVPMPYL